MNNVSNWLAYTGLFLLGTLLGSQINRAIYRWAWFSRLISPWSPADSKAPARRWPDRLPVIGWLGLRRETTIHGAGFWIRPLLLEIGVGVGLAGLYWWEIGRLEDNTLDLSTLFVRYLSHVTLFSLLVIASFIDFDEKTIPDLVTIPGTLIGLILAALAPTSLLPIAETSLLPIADSTSDWLHVMSPAPWEQWLSKEPTALFFGCACFLLWCLAILPKICTLRKGWYQGIGFMLASILRPRRRTEARLQVTPRQPYRITRLIGLLALLGTAMIVVVWWFQKGADGANWQGLLTALLGLAFGGGVVWGVRLIAGYTMQQEAMGFGDVTLMAMIGTFLGWQSTLIVFFLAPFAALIIGVIQLICVRRTDIAFGPYLALASIVLVVAWEPIWQDHASPFFGLGRIIPLLVVVCLILMGGLLAALQWLKRFIRGEDSEGASPG